MHDDERRLGERLRRYEARIPVGHEPPVVVRPNRVPMWALGAVAVALIGVAVLAANLVADDRQVGEASQRPSATSAPTTAPSGGRPDAGIITAVELQDAGRSLFLVFGGYMESCTDYEAETNVAGDVLEVLVTPTEEVISCRHALVERTLLVELDPPFTGTQVRNLATGESFPVGVATATATPTPSATTAATPAPAVGVAGVEWATAPAAVVPGSLSRITAVDGRFYALGWTVDSDERKAAVWSSTDGRSWQLAELPFPQSWDRPDAEITVSNLTSVGGRLVAIGQVWLGDFTEAIVWESSDGMSWTELDTGSFRAEGLWVADVTNGPRGLVAATSRYITAQDSAWRSTDGGRTWTEQRPPGDHMVLYAVVGTSDGYLMSGAVTATEWAEDPRPRIWSSNDGASWETVELEGSGRSGVVEQLTVDGSGTWVAIGHLDGRYVVWRSTDRRTWAIAADLGSRVPEEAGTFHLAGVPDGFIAILETNRTVTWTSDDGFTWVAQPDEIEAGLDGRGLHAGFATGIARIGGAVVMGGTLETSGSAAPGDWALWLGEIQR